MTIKKNQHASVRIRVQNPDHHLFNNNGTWWLHYTAYPTPQTTERIRRSLKTRDVEVARKRRDTFIAKLFYTTEPPRLRSDGGTPPIGAGGELSRKEVAA